MPISTERKREVLREGLAAQEERLFRLEIDLEANKATLAEVTDEQADAVQTAIEKSEFQIKQAKTNIKVIRAQLQKVAPQRSGNGRGPRKPTKPARKK